MFGSKSPRDLELNPTLEEILREDRKDDCMSCRVMGAGAFFGLGVYSYFSGHAQLRAQEAKILQSKSFFGMKSRRVAITGIALTLGGMGLWRFTH